VAVRRQMVNFKYFMTVHLRVIVRIKLSAYEDTCILLHSNVVNNVHISVIFCGHLQGGVL
jgi:hypothetical protein